MKQRSWARPRLIRAIHLSIALAAVLGMASPVTATPASTMATTWPVSNCNASGSGSLYAVVNDPSVQSGDTIDMSQLSCTSINLTGTLIIEQDNLSLEGQTGFLGFFPGFYIHAPANFRAIHHTGTGTLSLHGIDLSEGYVATSGAGACILSSGSVYLNSTNVHACHAETAANSGTDAKGGAISAAGDVSLYGFSSVYGSSATATNGQAYGGGIWAAGTVSLSVFSSASDNSATSIVGEKAWGGGIYAGTSVSIAGSSTVANNTVTAGSSGGIFNSPKTWGGGIYSAGTVMLDDAIIADNTATTTALGGFSISFGGGVYAQSNLDISHGSVIRGNHVDSDGGGIYANAQLDMDQSTVSGNSAGASGGAILVKGHALIARSTVSGNSSGSGAAVVLGVNASSAHMVRLTTVSGNEVTDSSATGAGLYLRHDANVFNSTITNNLSRTADSSHAHHAVGIAVGSNTSVKLWNTVVADNHLKGPTGGPLKPWDVGAADSASTASVDPGSDYSLVTSLDSALNAPATIITGTIPQLRPLADNGGPTETHLPAQDGPLVNAGNGAFATTDQRGSDRTVDGFADIGAVELTVAELDRIFADDFDG